MQAFQSVNRIGGIGKYNQAFLECLFQLYPDNEYLMLYNGNNKERIFEAKEFKIARQRVIRYFPGNDLNPFNRWIQIMNYHFKFTDILHILSPFEPQQNTVIANKMLPAKTVLTIYDFIPYIFKDLYLPSAISRDLYSERLKLLKSAKLLLSISEATKKDAINLFNIRPEKIINIGLAASNDYYKIDNLSSDIILDVKKKYQIDGNFILTVSNLDHRKNLLTLLQAFSSLPDYIHKEFSLVVICNSEPEYVKNNQAISELLDKNNKVRIKFLYFIPNNDLLILYNSCYLFVYASLYEGGGLPVLEAMKCGSPVIASNSSSIPEYMGRKDTLFNPSDINDIRNSMVNVLTNDDFRSEIRKHGLEFSKNFSWQNVARKAFLAYESI
jgi:glycosyltransferase involved in cell wall biosynthesis